MDGVYLSTYIDILLNLNVAFICSPGFMAKQNVKGEYF